MRISSSPLLFATLCLSLSAGTAWAQSWSQIAPVVTPTPRDGAALVYDPVHKQLVLFGGSDGDDTNQTWTLEGDVWTQHAPAHAPVARNNAYAFWDSARQRVVMFGGNAAGQIDRSTLWSWDGSDWSALTPSANPPPRRDAAVAYDSTRDRIVLFGGVVDGSPDVTLADTWEFDGSSWVQRSPATSPGDRGSALMGYDPVRELVLLVNGQSETTHGLRYDTWSYDGNSWTEIPNSNTPRGTSLEMIWDPTQQKLLIAGRKETGKLTAWYFDGAAWIEQPGASFNLNGLQEPGLAFDAERGYVMYLRQESLSYMGFRLRAGSWDQLLPVAQPAGAGLGRGALLFDQRANEPRLLVETSPGSGLQTWRWDGIMWRPLELKGTTRPSGNASAVYDAERELSFAFDSRTFELTGEAWMARSSAMQPPSGGALAYDASRGRSVYFGGVIALTQYSDATWMWSGTSWERLDVGGAPPARTRAAMAYDERRQRLVLFGGATFLEGQQRRLFDTWELRGSTWSEVNTVDGPTDLRDTPSMTYDQGRRRVVMWARQGQRDNQLWEFDGASWKGTAPPPIDGAGAIIGYDTAGKRLLLHDENGRTWARSSGDPAPDPDPANEPSADGGTPGPDGGAASEDAGRDDADGRVKGDEPEHAEKRGDSGCALGGQARGTGLGAWLLALAVLWLRRRGVLATTA